MHYHIAKIRITPTKPGFANEVKVGNALYKVVPVGAFAMQYIQGNTQEIVPEYRWFGSSD